MNASDSSKLLCLVATVLLNVPSANAAIDSRTILKTFFEDGDKPTEAQSVDLTDSIEDLVFTFGSFTAGHTVSAPAGGIATDVGNNGWTIGHINQAIGPGLVYQNGADIGSASDWPGQTGFLGFQFEINDAAFGPRTHYGFLQMSVDGPGSPTAYAIQITGIAYETTPDTAIGTFVIPEPTSCALFTLAMVSALLRRNRLKVD